VELIPKCFSSGDVNAEKVTLALREMYNVTEYCYLITYDVIKHSKLSCSRILRNLDIFPYQAVFHYLQVFAST
jgi:hypothetical protein